MFYLKQRELRPIEEMLVEGGTGGGEGARSVCQDPAHLLSHPAVQYCLTPRVTHLSQSSFVESLCNACVSQLGVVMFLT